MDNLIKYRNDRKSEGATIDDLKPIDARITTLLKRSQSVWAAELRLPAGWEGQATVKIVDGTDSVMRSAAPYTVDVNLATETVGDLAARACKVIGVGFMGVKLVNGGKHLDQATPLRNTLIRDGSLIAICNRLGCDGTCVAATLCQPAFAHVPSPASTALRALLRAAAAEPLPKTWACEALACEPRRASAVLSEAQGVPSVDPWHVSGGSAVSSAPTVTSASSAVPTEEDLYA